MSHIPFIFICILLSISAWAGRVSGTITDADGSPVPFASIFIKGSSRGTNANNEGKYFLNLDPGTYTLVCQHVGYAKQEKKITVTEKDEILDFRLTLQELTLDEVRITSGTDPAYEIIRQAIEKREYYKKQVEKFQCEVYTKGQFKLRNFPKKLLGVKVDFEDGVSQFSLRHDCA